jgi:hypothetical protein
MILSHTTVDLLVDTIKANIPLEKPDCFIAVAADCSIDLDSFRSKLKAENVSFIGAIYPLVFDEHDAYDDKILVKYYKFGHAPIFFNEECKSETDLTTLNADCANSLLLLSDPIHPHLSTFLVDLFKTFGNEKKVAGGGTMIRANKFGCTIFDQENLYNNHIVLIPFGEHMQLSLHHGWTEVSGPFIVTKTKGQNVVHLNWEPAREVFAKALPKAKEGRLSTADLFNLAREFPFGIYKELGECIVRDPIQFSENGITFLTEVPENAVMFILEGKNKSLFSASIKSVEESLANNIHVEDHLIFNCIGRKIALNENYKEEIQVMSSVSLNNKIEGVYSVGEIATNPNGFLEINNRSCLSISFYK